MKRRAQPWLGTLVEITIADTSDTPDTPSLSEHALNACFSEAFAAIGRVHRLMSFHDAGSDVSRINLAAVNDAVNIDAKTHEVISVALALAVASGGIFDITCAAPLARRGFLPAVQEPVPETLRGQSADIRLGTNTFTKTAPLWIDLGGIAKGYAVDQAIAVLNARGIRSACVNAGGDMRVLGTRPFAVSIRNPDRPTEAVADIMLADGALATSGTYFSRRMVDGVECSALLNGLAMESITTSNSASVRAAGCMLADALTKVVLATGNAFHPVLEQFDATAFII